MKFITLCILSFVGVKTFAAANLPSHLHCTSKAIFEEAKDFKITNIGTADTKISIYDASFGDLDDYRGTARLFFSNECDNSFDVMFFSSDLINLEAGYASAVKGLMNYSTPGNEDFIEETIEITCTK